MEINIYADVLFALNYFMDLLIIFSTALLARLPIKPIRMSAAAFILAAYGVLMLFPNLSFIFSALSRIVVSAIAIYVLAMPENMYKFFKILGVFWLVTIAIGGAVYAVTMMSDIGRVLKATIINGSLYIETNLWLLLTGTALAYGLILSYKGICTRIFSRDKILIPMKISAAGCKCTITALADTGCELTVPFSDNGIILVPEKLWKPSVPKTKAFFVPMQTADGNSGIWAFYPDAIAVKNANYSICGRPAVGIIKNNPSNDGLYSAILNPNIIIENKPNRSVDNEKIKTIFKSTSSAILTSESKKGILYRLKRSSAAAAEPGGRTGGAVKAEQSASSATCQTDPYRKKSAAGGIHSKEI